MILWWLVILLMWEDNYQFMLIKFISSCCKNCVINVGEEWTLPMSIPQFRCHIDTTEQQKAPEFWITCLSSLATYKWFKISTPGVWRRHMCQLDWKVLVANIFSFTNLNHISNKNDYQHIKYMLSTWKFQKICKIKLDPFCYSNDP